jgi:hypothetical protein
MSKVLVVGGGTISHVRNHLALCAPSYGGTARKLHGMFKDCGVESDLILTKMADPQNSILETSEELLNEIEEYYTTQNPQYIVMNAAICDFKGMIGSVPSGKYAERIKSRGCGRPKMDLDVHPKIINQLEMYCPALKVISFKTTCGATEDEQYQEVVRAAHRCSHLVIGNDTKTRKNIAANNHGNYWTFDNRLDILNFLVKEVRLGQ